MIQMRVNETRTVSADDLRQLCIRQNWYTKGTNEDYGKLLDMAHDTVNVTAYHIADMAEDIKEHSDTEYKVSEICFEIARICYSHFELTE